MSFPVYLFHFPLLCSVACGLFVVLQPAMSHQGTLLLVAAVYAPLVIGVGYLFARVDDLWLGWVKVLLASDHAVSGQPQHLIDAVGTGGDHRQPVEAERDAG